MILYIHGFNSSPQSHKAQVLAARMDALGRAAELLVPRLPHLPAAAMAVLEDLVVRHPDSALVGSSLGGYYATRLAERHGLKAVLINPAVRPYVLFGAYLGPQRNLYTGEEYVLTETHREQLLALEVLRVSRPQDFLLLLQTGDEVLDYREALEKFPDSPCRLTRGGDHGFEGFEAAVDEVLRFCAVLPDD